MKHFDVRWRGLRSFDDTGWVHIRPLTILLGPNSSGKSSFLLPFLLLKQTLEARDEDVALNSRGSLTNAGSYKDIVFQHEDDRTISFGFRFRSGMEEPDSDSPVGTSPPVNGAMVFAEGSYPGDIDLVRYLLKDEFGRILLQRRRRRKAGSYSMNRFLDVAAGVTDQEVQPDKPQTQESMSFIRADHPVHFMFTGRNVIGRWLDRTAEQRSELEGDEVSGSMSPTLTAYISVCGFFAGRLENLLNRISYVGPIRARFKRVYEVSGEAPASVGVEGEFTPEVIFQQQSPQLLDDINEWMKRFGFEGQLRTEAKGSDAFQILTGSGDRATNIADVGFGASQVLPLVVQALTGPENGMIIAEQPEIHLNPRLQTVLADLFAWAVGQNKGVLVETHSEHLLLRVRRLIAEGTLKPDDVTLLYVEHDQGVSTTREVPIAPNGHISPSEWPVGFFEDALSESLALASAQSDHNMGTG